MALKPKFIAKIINRKLTFLDPEKFSAHLSRFKPEAELEVTVAKYRNQRSVKQNNWYWGAVLPTISEETGHTPDELHEIYKEMFLPRRKVIYNGEEKWITGSTPDCDTIDFTNYVERIRAEVATMGIIVPDPQSFDL